MSQHDMTLDNGPGVVFRGDANNALKALASQSGGAAAPGVTFPSQLWADTGTGRLRQRNAANSVWLDRGPLDATLRDAASDGTYAADTGAVNAFACSFVPAITARSESTPLRFKVANGNSGACTINDGFGTAPLVGATHAALQGGETVASGIALIQWNGSIGGSGAYVLLFCTGAAEQVGNATKSQHAVNAGQIQNQSLTAFTTAGTAPSFTLTPSPAITAYAAGQRFRVKFHSAGAGADTVNVSALGAKAFKQYDGSGSKVAATIAAGQLTDVEYDGTDCVLLDPLPADVTLPFAYFSGFRLANNVTTPATTIDVALGAARDSADAVNIKLTSTIRGVLQSAGAWTAGDNQNKLDTGAKASSTTYHLFSIRKTSDGTGDILFSLSATAPTLPSGYTGYRRLGRIATDASGNIRAFKDRGDGKFDWVTPSIESTGAVVGSNLVTLSAFGGVAAEARINAAISGDGSCLRITASDQADSTLSSTAATYAGGLIANNDASVNDGPATGEFMVMVDSAAQVRLRTLVSSGNIGYRIIVMGWRESR